MADLRRHPRKRLRVEFTFRDEEGAGDLSLEGANLSAGGAFLESDLLLEPGEPLAIAFAAPGRTVTARAEVVWARRFPEEGQAAGMGVRFGELSQEDRRALEALLGEAATP
jgi:uncharacterized protein (TIGR02266 family)